jgi:ribA/ribD-fused uncharacterized protein
MSTEILGFFGPFRFLSNFWLCPVVYEGITYRSSEEAYQAAKTLDPEMRRKILDIPELDERKMGHRARQFGKQVTLRDDWEDVKFSVMLEILRDKFTRNGDHKESLLVTGDAYLEETNSWGDVYWGVCKGTGENNLGKILMQIRDELRKQ